MNQYLFSVSEDECGERIDKYLTSNIPNLTRSYIQKIIENREMTVNDRIEKSSYRLKAEDKIILNVPDSIIPDILPEDIPIDIVYEDDDFCIVNKPKGMVVHPANGHYSGTLVNALMFHLSGRLSGINGILRPGIVHRIDKDTSGLLIICKNDAAHNFIAAQLKEHTCNRVYHAICHGNISEDDIIIDKPIGRSKTDRKKMSVDLGGKRAVTHVHVLERLPGYTYIECRLETGRTHQIRVHMASINHPLMGDPLYCTIKEPIKVSGQMLHAKEIGLISPSTHEYLSFDSELPKEFIRVLDYLRSL